MSGVMNVDKEKEIYLLYIYSSNINAAWLATRKSEVVIYDDNERRPLFLSILTMPKKMSYTLSYNLEHLRPLFLQRQKGRFSKPYNWDRCKKKCNNSFSWDHAIFPGEVMELVALFGWGSMQITLFCFIKKLISTRTLQK